MPIVLALADEMVLDRPGHRFRPTCRPQLGQNVAHMKVHRRSGYDKPAGDGRVAESLHQKYQHFAFARAQIFAWWRRPAGVLDQCLDDFRRERRTARRG